MSSPSAPMPVRTEVLRPSAKSGLVTKRSRDSAGPPSRWRPSPRPAMWPSTTTTSTACEASAAFTACTTSGGRRHRPAACCGPPMRVERPAASTSTATRGACRGAGLVVAVVARLRAGWRSRPAGRRRPCARSRRGRPARPAARRSSTMSKPLYLGDLAQPGRPSTGLPSSSAVSSRLPGSTGMPKWMTSPPACSMPAGTTSWRSTIAEAPAIRKMSQPSPVRPCRAPRRSAFASWAQRRSPTSALPSEVRRLAGRCRPPCPAPCRGAGQPGLHQAGARIALNGATAIRAGWPTVRPRSLVDGRAARRRG